MNLKVLNAIKCANGILLRAWTPVKFTKEKVSQLSCFIGNLLMCFGPSFVEKIMPGTCNFSTKNLDQKR